MIYKLMLWNAIKNSRYGHPSILHNYNRDEIRMQLGEKKYFLLVDSKTYQIKQEILGAKEEHKILILH